MDNLKNRLYKLKRVYSHIIYLQKNFINWDSIIKRAVKGKSTKELNLRNGLTFYDANFNTLSIFNEIFVKKVYTSDIINIEENDVVFDIGANVGVFSLYASLIKGVSVFAFEPHPENFKKLSHNVEQNNLINVECIEYALGLKNEDRFMIEGNIAGGHKVAQRDSMESKDGLLKVQSITLDSIMKKLNIDKIDFLKLDCEGAEGEIISSLGKEGLKKINKIAVEFHDNHSILNHTEILKYLKDSGFKTSLSWDGSSYFGYIYGKR
ncbi:FkbM family methyltransferase [Aequorivita nionensis]|uniref:FkbM family methyltransferase n=1 Tax=Aequorivita nionensis TaxID=1287690 RepID=UPI003965B842